MWLWGFVAVICFSATNAQDTAVYSLPSFSLVLKVDKTSNDLIVFQDRLETAVRTHLTDFFKQKVESPSLGDGNIDEVALSQLLVWKELSSGGTKVSDETQGTVHQYEARGEYDCQLELIYNSAGEGHDRLSGSIMDLFLIEAFQGDNYWHLVHNFLSDEILEDITDVKITVMTDGYIAYHGQDVSAFDDYNNGGVGDWTGAMTVGVIFASFFCLALVLMWVYLCFCVQGTFLFKSRNPNQKDIGKEDESVTDDLYSTSSVEFQYEDEDEEQTWMDAWANAITSIPLREPIRIRRKKKGPSIRHPAQQHNSYLGCIEEAGADEECSLASMEEVNNTQRKNKLMIKPRDPPAGSKALVPYVPNTTEMVEYQPSPQKSRTQYNFGRSQPQFEYTTSQPQLDNKEVC
jgi:hypothetical protein